jgi:hypothetical protein
MKILKWMVLAVATVGLAVSCCEEDTITVPAEVVAMTNDHNKSTCATYYQLKIEGQTYVCSVEDLDHHGELGTLPTWIELEYSLADETPTCSSSPLIEVEEWERY